MITQRATTDVAAYSQHRIQMNPCLQALSMGGHKQLVQLVKVLSSGNENLAGVDCVSLGSLHLGKRTQLLGIGTWQMWAASPLATCASANARSSG